MIDYEQNIQNMIHEGEINGIKYVAKIVRPYNFWSISPATGGAPKELDGLFTSRDEAEKAFKNYADRVSAKKIKKNPTEE